MSFFLSVTTRVASAFSDQKHIERKQAAINNFAGQLFNVGKKNADITNSSSSCYFKSTSSTSANSQSSNKASERDMDTKTKLRRILVSLFYDLGKSDKSNCNVSDQENTPLINKDSMDRLREKSTHNALSRFFGANKMITRSVVNAVVLVYLKAKKADISECFKIDGYLKIDKFKEFLKIQLDKSEHDQVIRNITPRYLEEIKYNSDLHLIIMGDYHISTYGLVDEVPKNNEKQEANAEKKDVSHETSSEVTAKQEDALSKEVFVSKDDKTGYITNKYIRSTYSEHEIIAAKKAAVEYFSTTISDKLKQFDENKKIITIRKLIYLQRIINVAMRHLVLYKTGYAVLRELFTDIFADLNVTADKDKIHFLNNVIMINYHRNCGMCAQRMLKAPIMLIWSSLPLISTAGMVAAGVTTFGVLGLPLGIVGIVGALVEGGGDIMNYGEHTNTINQKLNCGDSLSSTTDSYKKVVEMLCGLISEENKKKLFPNYPKNAGSLLLSKEEIEEKLNSGNTHHQTSIIQHIDGDTQIQLEELNKPKPEKLSQDKINAERLKVLKRARSQCTEHNSQLRKAPSVDLSDNGKENRRLLKQRLLENENSFLQHKIKHQETKLNPSEENGKDTGYQQKKKEYLLKKKELTDRLFKLIDA